LQFTLNTLFAENIS